MVKEARSVVEAAVAVADAVAVNETAPGAVAEEDAHADSQWYVIHTYSGYENKVKTNLEHRIASMDMKDKIFQVVIPVEDEVEVKDGQRRTVQRKDFPGYVLVQMLLGDDSWYVVRNTPGVTGFVGAANVPIPSAMRPAWPPGMRKSSKPISTAWRKYRASNSSR